MTDAVIVDAVRTPVGKNHGALAGIHPVDLSAHVLRTLLSRTGLDPSLVDDVLWGCVSQVGEQSMNIGRNAVLAAGMPESVPATTMDRQCGSSQQAVHFAAAGIVAGHYNIAIAGGVESMSRVPLGSSQGGGADVYGPSIARRYPSVAFNQGVSAELIARRWKLSRQQLDEFSLASHEKAATAIDSGELDDQYAPIEGVIQFDEGVRRTTSLEKLAALQPAFARDGVVTAGNSSQISDGASAILVMSADWALQLGLTPIARIRTCVVAGDDPVLMLTAPIPATAKALARSQLTIGEIGAFEVNEAFAPVPLAWLADTGADPKALNPHGGAIAVGHPLGGSGGVLMTRLIHHMRHRGIRYGLQTMCEGGGLANATILELL